MEQVGPRRELALLEAALYVAGRPLDLKTLASVIKTRSRRKAERLARMLVEEYGSRGGCIEVLELEDQRFVMQLRAEYTPEVRRLTLRPLLSMGPLKTLSYIAYRQPVPQSQVIDVRGQHAYDHIKQLEDLGLIDREREGRTKVVRTTPFFADYFGLSHDMKIMRLQLKTIFEDYGRPEKSESSSQKS